METIETTNNVKQNDVPVKTYLTAEHQLELHTKTGQLLFNGQWRYGELGLIQFAKIMSRLWKAHKEDDPYADWYLIKTFDALEETKERFKGYENYLKQQIESLRGFKVNLFTSPTPLYMPIRLGTAFACMAVVLIEQADYVARQLYTLRRIGLIPENKLAIRDIKREVQAVFSLPIKWKYTAITRKDIRENNQKAQKVKLELSEVPVDILNETLRFAFLPNMKGKHNK